MPNDNNTGKNINGGFHTNMESDTNMESNTTNMGSNTTNVGSNTTNMGCPEIDNSNHEMNNHEMNKSVQVEQVAPPVDNSGKPNKQNTREASKKQQHQQQQQQFKSQWESLQQENLCSGDYYFNSYAHFSIHEEMLKDRVRTTAYERAIVRNKHLFDGKIVLDVGSGTGILCLFAAKAGAKHVYGIECSEIVETAKKIATDNNFKDRITFIKGKAEEITLPVDKVDIIISEWMGYFLLYESMLDTVLLMRDKYLVEGGLMFPDRASLHMAGLEDGDYKEEKIGYWDNVYGFNYSCVKKSVMEEPIVDCVDEKKVVTDSCCVLDLDLYRCTKEDLDFVSSYKLRMRRKDDVHALVVWFEIAFGASHHPVTFTTGPHGPYTHWKQTVFYIDDVLPGFPNNEVHGMIAVKKNAKNPRDLDIKISYDFAAGKRRYARTHYYRLR